MDIYPEDIEVINRYLVSLESHLHYVEQAAVMLGIPSEWVADHDKSKYDPIELHAYARNFYGDKSRPDDFAVAWLHHIHNNPHHWQYWIFPDGYSFGTIKGIVPMPRRYYMEMIADWMGTSRAYTGSWDMSGWLERNMGNILLHPKTAEGVRRQLDEMGYGAIVNRLSFKNEAAHDT